jgi:hypothetical protein
MVLLFFFLVDQCVKNEMYPVTATSGKYQVLSIYRFPLNSSYPVVLNGFSKAFWEYNRGFQEALDPYAAEILENSKTFL